MAQVNSKTNKHCLVGLLYCNPISSFCKSENLNPMSYLHHRFMHAINIFCSGYGAYWPESKYSDLFPAVNIDKAQWHYSDAAFVQAVEDFELGTKWRYSSVNELPLLDVVPSADEY